MLALKISPMARRKPDEIWRNALGDRLRLCRERLEVTQLELSELLGVSRQAIGLWETGASAPSDEHKVALATLCGVSLDWLLRGDQRVADNQGTYSTLGRTSVAEEINDIVGAAKEDLTVSELRRIRDLIRFMVQQARQEGQNEGGS